jgi:putative protease
MVLYVWLIQVAVYFLAILTKEIQIRVLVPMHVVGNTIVIKLKKLKRRDHCHSPAVTPTRESVDIYLPEQKNNPIDDIVLLQEQGRPSEYMPTFEDEHGTYIINSKDRRAVEHVARLVKIGIHSIKIESRTKSFYYCARTAQIYNQAILDVFDDKPFDQKHNIDLEHLSHRGYTEGFLKRHRHGDTQNYDSGYSKNDSQQFVAEVLGCSESTSLIEIDVKNKFLVGARLELMTPKGNGKPKTGNYCRCKRLRP